MDDIVKAALAKWPNVPACYGWLGLDARGQWFMRDDPAQAAGPFAGPGSTPASRGSHLKHEKLIDFIARNYEADAQGCWFFQNGPQRVYVELEATPLIWRVHDDFSVRAHTGQSASVQSSWLDELGRLYLQTERGLGLVHSQDMVQAAEAVEQGLWLPQEMFAQELPQRFAFVRSPAALRPAPPLKTAPQP
ncbi:MAG: DUF2946 family protein [Betaproteobacteria bacterium]